MEPKQEVRRQGKLVVRKVSTVSRGSGDRKLSKELQR